MDLIPALVAPRDIAAGEELTIDYALFLADSGFAMACRCPATAGRGVVRGTDWMRAGLQARYRGWSSRCHTTPRSNGHTESAIRQRRARSRITLSGRGSALIRMAGLVWLWFPASGW